MDFWKTMGVLLRRWYVSVPIFVLCVLLGGGVFVAVPTQYESTGTMVLTAPVSGGFVPTSPANAQGPGNPLLDFGGSLVITTQLLIQSLSSPTVQNQIAEQGGASTFQAGDGETGGPFVVIIADAKSKAQAERTVTLALKYAATELDQRQKAVQAPPSTFIGTQVVVAATPATRKLGSKVKAGGVALAGGVVLSLAAAFAAESVLANRRRRRAEEEAELDSRLADLAEDELDDEARAATHKMRPAPPPRQLPQPVRSAGPRAAQRPPVGTVAGGRREIGPLGKPHPAKPRVHPAPVPTKVPNINGSPINGSPLNGGPVNGNKPGGTNGVAQNGQGGNRDWPRTEFHSPDSSSG